MVLVATADVLSLYWPECKAGMCCVDPLCGEGVVVANLKVDESVGTKVEVSSF